MNRLKQPNEIPQHVAIIMDGNGRWAKQRRMSRVAGHTRGAKTVRTISKACIARGITHLTLFAFSSENWHRPAEEVSFLMSLFMRALDVEVAKMHKNGIRLRVIGDLSRFDKLLVDKVRAGEALTGDNTRLTLTIAANYGGRWDILQAINRMLATQPEKRGNFSESDLARHLMLADEPAPDLLIRTGGEQRISNFLLWQLTYTELYFTDLLWPEFNVVALDMAILSYMSRERRFGRTSEQLNENSLKKDFLIGGNLQSSLAEIQTGIAA